MMIQKTWLELFGPITACDYAEGKELIRWLGGNNYKTLWKFEKPESAQSVFDQWKLETMQAYKQTKRSSC
jgi:hypothetical protein